MMMNTKMQERVASMLSSDPISEATKLLERRREIQTIQTQLDEKRREHKKKDEKMTERQNEYDQKRQQFEEQKVQYDKFIKQNDSKRGRATRKISQEKNLQQELEKQKKTLVTELQNMKEAQRKMKHELESLRPYKQFLDDISRDREEILDIGEVLLRKEVMEMTNKDLFEGKARMELEYDKLQEEYEKVKLSHKFTLLDKSTTVESYNKMLESAQIRRADLQWKTENKVNKKRHETDILGQVLRGIENGFDMCVQRSKTLQSTRIYDAMKQLTFVEHFITNYMEIVQEYHAQ